MKTKTYQIVLQVDDLSESDYNSYDAEDVELAIEEALRNNLPDDLTARILEVVDESLG